MIAFKFIFIKCKKCTCIVSLLQGVQCVRSQSMHCRRFCSLDRSSIAPESSMLIWEAILGRNKTSINPKPRRQWTRQVSMRVERNSRHLVVVFHDLLQAVKSCFGKDVFTCWIIIIIFCQICLQSPAYLICKFSTILVKIFKQYDGIAELTLAWPILRSSCLWQRVLWYLKPPVTWLLSVWSFQVDQETNWSSLRVVLSYSARGLHQVLERYLEL